MITNLDRDTLRTMVESMARGNLSLVEVKTKKGTPLVAICINVPEMEGTIGRWVPIAILQWDLVASVLPSNGMDWRAFGKTVSLAGERESAPDREVAPNMPRAALLN